MSPAERAEKLLCICTQTALEHRPFGGHWHACPWLMYGQRISEEITKAELAERQRVATIVVDAVNAILRGET